VLVVLPGWRPGAWHRRLPGSRWPRRREIVVRERV